MKLLNAMRNILAGIAVCCVVSPGFCDVQNRIPRYAEQNGFLVPNLTRGVVNPQVFLKEVRSKFQELNKDQYETAEEFSERTAVQEQRFRVEYPHEYVFRSVASVKYNADKQVYYSDFSDAKCFSRLSYRAPQNKNHDIGSDYSKIFCAVGVLSSRERTYSASTRFGVAVDVSSEKTDYISLMFTNIPLNHPEDYGFVRREYASYDLALSNALFVPVQLAKTLRTERLSVLFVGRVVESSIIKHYKNQYPTLDSPYESHKTYHGIQFHLTQILLCVDRTGEIIARKQVQ